MPRRSTAKASIILLLTVGILLGCMLALMSVLSQKGEAASGGGSASLPAEPVAETRGVTVEPKSDRAPDLPSAEGPKQAAPPSDTGSLSADPRPRSATRATTAARVAPQRAQKTEPERRRADPAPAMPRMAEVSPRSF